MRAGYLNEYFAAVVVKRLSAVEIDGNASNQHELNGTKALRRLLGQDGGGTVHIPTRFIQVNDDYGIRAADGMVSWYDSRRANPKRTEYRLYYPTTIMSENACAGDSLFVARRPDRTLMMIVATAGTTVERQLLWLFDLEDPHARDRFGKQLPFKGRTIDTTVALDLSARLVLEELGIDIAEPDANQLDVLLEPFGGKLPATAEFSAFARSTLPEVSAKDDPDTALVRWLEREEKLFRRLERHRIESRIHAGFLIDGETDIEGFIQFSLSVQNSRKSRAGHAFENHIGAVLEANGVRHSRGKQTEGRSKPDFLFPGIDEYRNSAIPDNVLTMLGAKTSCKDRWRQVLVEAARLPEKHLLTIEPAISEHQTNEMRERSLQLVIPSAIQASFTSDQQDWLLSVSDFIGLVLIRQAAGYVR